MLYLIWEGRHWRNHLSLQLYSIWFQFHPFRNYVCHRKLSNTASRTFIIKCLLAAANVVAKSLQPWFLQENQQDDEFMY